MVLPNRQALFGMLQKYNNYKQAPNTSITVIIANRIKDNSNIIDLKNHLIQAKIHQLIHVP